MAQETAKVVIDRLQGEAGHATGGYIDRLVFSGLDVHEMLNEIEQAIDTDKLSAEKLQEQLNTAKKALTEIADVKRRLEQTTDFGVGFQPTYNALEFVVAESKKALAEIGGDDE